MKHSEDPSFVHALRRAAPYVHSHNGRVFVLVFGGEVAQRTDFQDLIYDIALLHSFGVKLVLVHGARPQIDALAAARGQTPHFVGDTRISDAETMDCVRAAVGALRIDIESRLSTGLASTPMGGVRLRVAGGNWITARPVGVREGIDHQLTGDVRRVDAESIRNVLCSGRIALLSPIGYSPTGETFNLRAGDVAQAIATALGADKLIFLLNSSPLSWPTATEAGDAGQLSLTRAEAMLTKAASEASFTAEDQALLRSALVACQGGVTRVHLLGIEPPGTLLRELYTRDGCGLMLYTDMNYDVVRSATIDDIGGVMELVRPMEEAGILVPRSREQLELQISHFDVMIRDGSVIACASTFPFAENFMAELYCVAVKPDYRRAGRAATLLARAEDNARKAGIRQLFVLTTHTPHWFIEHGFRRGRIEDLPMQKQNIYNYQRNSIVLIKHLQV